MALTNLQARYFVDSALECKLAVKDSSDSFDMALREEVCVVCGGAYQGG
jgi:hypothetical protein